MTAQVLPVPGRWPAPFRSLFSQLVGIVLVIALVGAAAGTLITHRVADIESDRVHDAGLIQLAGLLLGLVHHELDELPADASVHARVAMGRADSAGIFGGRYRYQIWDKQGKFLLGNHGLPGESALGAPGMTGLHCIEMDGAEWRFLSMTNQSGDLEIRIAELEAARGDLAGQFGLILLLLLGPMAAMWWAARWALANAVSPLNQLARTLQQRSASDLGEIHTSERLAELQPVTEALNRLFVRVREAIQRESGFTALAAHELRTPLAVMRAIAANAIHTTNPQEREAALHDLVASVDRCSHLQDQLLTLSRLETSQALEERVDLAELMDEVLTACMPELRAKHLRVQLDVDASAVRGHRFGLQTMVRNLLANAARHAPQEGTIALTARREASHVVIRVDDSGHGIPEEDRVRALRRFERLNQSSGPGAGLGLAIVQTVAQAHGAQLRLLGSPLGGLRVEVDFGEERVIVDPHTAERFE